MMRTIRIDSDSLRDWAMVSKPLDQATPPTTSAAPETVKRPADGKKRPTVDSHVLFAGGSEVVIFHYGETYQLRQTRLGKLILTK